MKTNSHYKMLLGVALGAGGGLLANAFGSDASALKWTVDNVAMPLGQLFLRLLFMLVVPMLFSAVVVGIAGLELRKLRRMGIRTLAYAAVVSAIAVGIGLTLVNVLGPGRGLPDEVRQAAFSDAARMPVPRPLDVPLSTMLVQMVPDNPVKAAANGDMLGLIVFSVLFGVALSVTQAESAKKLLGAIEGLYEVSLTLIHGVLRLAPYGVAALLFAMMARMGFTAMKQLAAYVGVVLLALSLHMFGVYSLSVKFFGGRSPLQFFKDIRLAMVTAFATSSSSATLPTALQVAEESLKLPPHVSRFVLTAGSAMNQNGTALFEGVTVLFLAQLFGVELSLGNQLTVMLICILGGIGTAGIPAASLPVIAMICGMFGIPPEGLGLILGVDRFLDMCRTTLNVTGDLAAAVYVAKAEAADAEAGSV